MSVYEHSPNAFRAPHAQRTPRVTVAQLFLRAVQRWQRNRTIAALRRMDDRQLEDIGVARNDIPRVVEGLFRPSDGDRPAGGSKDAGSPVRP